MSDGYQAEQSYAEAKADFILKTYGHLLGAVVLFTLIEVWLFQSGWAQTIAQSLLGVNWLFVLGAFFIVAWLASHLAHRIENPAVQYAALGGYVLAESIIFVPLLYLADSFAPGAIENAALATIIGFVVLTAIVFYTRKNFSFLAPALMWGGIAALVLIVCSVLFGFQLGFVFSVVMVAYAGAAILYDTSRVLHDYGPGQHVAAALELFAAVALMFWYLLQIFMSSDD
jgi:FtsH-binding integral membrane protein